jgi:glycosyltransferase involved in cell wall biosynthesis
MNEAPRRRVAPIRGISAVLPAYNEAANLSQMVARTLEALDDAVPEYEVIIVDDGSRDATPRLADGLAARDPRIRVIHQAGRRGYGAAIRAGVDEATKQFIWCLDADGQYNPADISRLVQWDDANDVVAGYRLRRADPAYRVLLSRCYRLLIRLVLGIRSRDPNCGFKLFRATTLKSLPLTADGRLIQVEILARLRERNVPVREVGVRHVARHAGRQTGARPRVVFTMIRELVVLRRKLREEEAASRRGAKPDASG